MTKINLRVIQVFILTVLLTLCFLSCDKIFDTNKDEEQRPVIQVAEGYTLEKIMSTVLGLPFQNALLPNGDIAICDPNNNRIVILSNNAVRTLVEGNSINAYAVAVLPDGRVCYGNMNDQLMAIDPASGESVYFSRSLISDHISALTTDQNGNIYVATSSGKLYRSDSNGNISTITTNLPFDDHSIFDMDVASDGTIYIAGCNRVVSVDKNSNINTIADDLINEPVWVEIAPDGILYINELAYGLQQYNPANGQLTQLQITNFNPFNDILCPSVNEIIFYDLEIFYKYNFTTSTAISLFAVYGNSWAFAVNANNTVFFSTPGNPSVLNSHIISLQSDGTIQDLNYLTYGTIMSADVNKNNRLCLSTNQGFQRVESDNTTKTVTPAFPPGFTLFHVSEFSVGPSNYWYVITSDNNNTILVYRFDESGNFTFLPIAFDCNSFGGVYRVDGASIDVGDDGRLALIVTARGSLGQGPFYQRVYRANADGSNLVEIANFDSDRTCGMVDIAVAPNNDIFVLSVQESSEMIYRIDQNNAISVFVDIFIGNDPKSIDVDPHGNLWFSTTTGIFRVTPN